MMQHYCWCCIMLVKYPCCIPGTFYVVSCEKTEHMILQEHSKDIYCFLKDANFIFQPA